MKIFFRIIILITEDLRKLSNYFFFILLFILFFSKSVFGEIKNFTISQNNINNIINTEVKESFSYSGLASFYNDVEAYIVSNDRVQRLKNDIFYNLTSNQFLIIVGHYKILIIDNVNSPMSFGNQEIIWQKKSFKDKNLNEINLEVKLLPKSDLKHLADIYQKLKYIHLWKPFRLACTYIESNLIWLNSFHTYGWGVTIILLSLIFKIFILPVNILLIFSQKKISHIQSSLSSELKNIKLNFSGEEAHNKFLAAHKTLGVSPYYRLKPFFLTLFPIPFFIAIFNVLGEMDLIVGHSFLWIKDLAYPDTIFHIGFDFPFLGNGINLLPILMAVLSICGTFTLHEKVISAKSLGRQKFNLYIISIGFLFLFYPFPSAMVLYWTFNNIWQILLQIFYKI